MELHETNLKLIAEFMANGLEKRSFSNPFAKNFFFFFNKVGDDIIIITKTQIIHDFFFHIVLYNN